MGRSQAWQHTCAVHGLTPMTAELMVELAGKPVHELLDVVAEQSGKASHQVDRLAFFDTKGRFYVDNHSPVGCTPPHPTPPHPTPPHPTPPHPTPPHPTPPHPTPPHPTPPHPTPPHPTPPHPTPPHPTPPHPTPPHPTPPHPTPPHPTPPHPTPPHPTPPHPTPPHPTPPHPTPPHPTPPHPTPPHPTPPHPTPPHPTPPHPTPPHPTPPHPTPPHPTPPHPTPPHPTPPHPTPPHPTPPHPTPPHPTPPHPTPPHPTPENQSDTAPLQAQVIEATLDIVRAGAAAGLPMAVASGGSRAHVLQGLTETGILHYFQAVVCAEDVTNGKPAPDGFLLAAEKLGVAPEFCVGYEDAKLGMEAIAAAGFMAAVDVTVLPNYPHLV
ncbi:hypothetical protein QJQ45_000850 [Haematococcus lacustris]|nr:hypothetical protein QJQ45_000850 [Haematococcus lacustris]